MSARPLDDVRAAWDRSDRLFTWLHPEALWSQPIALRQPFIFYLGHLPAFACNHLGRRRLRRDPFRPELDVLFERGIDPVDGDAYVAADRSQWPHPDEVIAYRCRVREALEAAERAGDLESSGARDDVAMVVEHELMHHETLLYMVQALESEQKIAPAEAEPPAGGPGLVGGVVEVPPGCALLGAPRGTGRFGWDNEFPEPRFAVPEFAMDKVPERNRDFLDVAREGR